MPVTGAPPLRVPGRLPSRKLASRLSCPDVLTRAHSGLRSRRSSSRTIRSAFRCTAGARVARYYDPATAQFLTRDPIEPLTQQAYQYANGDPLDQIDPLGLCGHWYDVACQVGSAAATVGGAVADHWHGIAQVATLAAVGVGTGTCIAATGGLCAAALPFIGAGTGAALYGESSGRHTLGGYASAFAEGGIAGSLALVCEAGACVVAGSALAGGALANGLFGAGQGAWDYGSESCDHSIGGYATAALKGALEGGLPWDDLSKIRLSIL